MLVLFLRDELKVEVRTSDPAIQGKVMLCMINLRKKGITESQNKAFPWIINLRHCCLRMKCWLNMPGILLLKMNQLKREQRSELKVN